MLSLVTDHCRRLHAWSICECVSGLFALLQEDETRGSQQRGRLPRCIVLAPTRELAQQVEREFEGAAPTLTCGVFYGGALIAGFAAEAVQLSSQLIHYSVPIGA